MTKDEERIMLRIVRELQGIRNELHAMNRMMVKQDARQQAIEKPDDSHE